MIGTETPDNMGQSVERKCMTLYRLISKQISPTDSAPLNIYEIKNYCYYGFSDIGLRPKYWKVFLEHYSKNKFKTETFLRKRRDSYGFYTERINDDFEGREGCHRIIENDVSRTFIKPQVHTNDAGEEVKSCGFLDSVSANTQETHRAVVERMLKCYAMTNSSIRYVQGMNLVLIPIYYVLYHSDDAEDQAHCEEDAFFCFNYLMTEIGENFIEDLDGSNMGITHKMSRVMEMVREADEDLYNVMRDKGLTEGGFHMKWIMLMFVSCFSVEDVIWLWDRLLSDAYRFEMLLYCCASVIVIMKNIIVEEDFDVCMEFLQEPSIISIGTIFNTADHLRRKHYEATGRE